MLNKTTKNKLKEKVKVLPTRPGVYKFKNSKKEIIYIGKAKNLKSRVGSYFQKNIDPVTKTAALISKIASIEIIETQSELEALILEAELIKRYKPKYNIVLKDDRSHLYIVIRPQKVEVDNKKTNIPIVLALRQTDLLKNDITFGPYPDTTTTRYVVNTIRKVFAYRDCSVSKFNRYKKQKDPCLYGQIGLCQAPCVKKVSPNEYRRDIKKIQRLLQGESNTLLKSLARQMKQAAKEKNFEKAAFLRDKIKKFEYIRHKSYKAQKYIDNPYLVNDLRQKALQELKKNIPILKTAPQRIECYDISNISGTDAVGSMVVATGGNITKSEYRKFKIKRKNLPDDFAMMAEVLSRRLKNNWELPDLIVVDGGKGQVSSVNEILKLSEMMIPLVGLAKKFETIVFLQSGIFKEVVLTKDNEGLKLLQRLRDESHRFAQNYHHKLRLKRIKTEK